MKKTAIYNYIDLVEAKIKKSYNKGLKNKKADLSELLEKDLLFVKKTLQLKTKLNK